MLIFEEVIGKAVPFKSIQREYFRRRAARRQRAKFYYGRLRSHYPGMSKDCC